VKPSEVESLLGARLEDRWQPHGKEFVSGSWWLSYSGSDTCLLTVYFRSTTKALDRQGDSAIHFRFELSFVGDEPKKGRVAEMRYKDYSVTNDHLWISP
jgi:hypothetical protein